MYRENFFFFSSKNNILFAKTINESLKNFIHTLTKDKLSSLVANFDEAPLPPPLSDSISIIQCPRVHKIRANLSPESGEEKKKKKKGARIELEWNRIRNHGGIEKSAPRTMGVTKQSFQLSNASLFCRKNGRFWDRCAGLKFFWKGVGSDLSVMSVSFFLSHLGLYFDEDWDLVWQRGQFQSRFETL